VSPNPIAADGAVFRWDLGRAAADEATLSLRILDVAGRTVRRVADGLAASGRAAWDGRDGEGRRLPAGVYLWRLERSDGSGAEGGKVSVVR
jgi:hypothetical protein